MKSRKVRGVCIGVAVVVVVVVAFLAALSACSTGTAASDTDSNEVVAANPVAQETNETGDKGVSAVDDGAREETPDVDASGENASVAAAEPIVAEAQPASQSATAQAKDVALSPGENTSESGECPTPPQPQRKWVEDTEKVWVEDKAAWIEQVPIYGTKEVSICNVCGADVTGNTSTHGKAHMLAGEGSGHHSEVKQIVTGYNTVNHAAEGHWETKVIGGHWE
ncbi:hypothetical protein [Adlercreutzia sp. ZJ141]|uniref:hypothetical protein n=1 Tax=Adlercreutzia sp. ZJ141 TaxID=2709406 RepID=UPI0013EDE8D2|nr:hypothetical protein [Adlercreutzia sp. ZJ141]